MKNKLIILTAALLIGGLGMFQGAKIVRANFWTDFWARFGSNTSSVNDAFNSKGTALRMELNNLLKEHTVMAGASLIARYAGVRTDRLNQLMDANKNELAMAMQNIYGINARNEFMALWDRHMNEYRNYTDALKNKDNEAMAAAKNNLDTTALELGKLFAANSTHIASSEVERLMKEHVGGTLAIVDAISQGDEAASSGLLKKGYDQAGTLADVLARGMLLDNPNNMFTQ